VSERVAIACAAALLCTAAGCGGGPSEAEKDRAISAAEKAYVSAKGRGVDFANGPCLGVVMEGWVADVAHDPRQAIDDRAENQCEAYRSGEADHFVELDPAGNVIRVE
jgi:hypothetical protein